MEAIIRNVRDIDAGERQVLEHVLGQKLKENQQVLFQVVTPETEIADERSPTSAGLPDWCDVFDGLNDEQIADVESVIHQQSDLTRLAE